MRGKEIVSADAALRLLYMFLFPDQSQSLEPIVMVKAIKDKVCQHDAAIAQAVAAERERCRRIVEWHFGRDTMKSLECTSEIENAIRARTTP